MSKQLLILTILTLLFSAAIFKATNAADSSQPSLSAASLSPGVVIGHTWYDHQQNYRMGRMIDYNENIPFLFFGWTYMPDAPPNEFVMFGRKYAYNTYSIESGIVATPKYSQTDDYFAGYVNIDVELQHPYITGHQRSAAGQDEPNRIYTYEMSLGIDWIPPFTIPDSIATYATGMGNLYENLWPTIQVQLGTDTVVHIFAQSEIPGESVKALYYYRRVGNSWDYPPYIVDTVSTISQEVVADRNSDKIALVWVANVVPSVEFDGCDTCSDNSLNSDYDNDLYYQISYDQGSYWEPRENITKNRPGNVGYRPSADLTTLIDSQGELHIVVASLEWNGTLEQTTDLNACRLLHWSEDQGYFRTIKVAEDLSVPTCIPDKYNMWLAKPQLSECNGNLYTTWVDFTGGATGDCASWGTDGSANGELYVAASSDDGLNWGEPFNLTNTPTPDCDPSSGYNCASENWASMTRFAIANQPTDDWSQAVVIDPDPAHPYLGDSYLDVQYVEDKDAGSIVWEEGSWQDNNLRWFRMACYEPIMTNTTCCLGVRGNIDGDIGEIEDIGDLVYMVDYQFRNGDEPACFEEADVTGDGVVDVEDLICMINQAFLDGCDYAPCP